MILNKIEMFDLIAEHFAKFEAKADPEEFSWASRSFEKMCGYDIPGDLEKKSATRIFPKSLKEIYESSTGRRASVELTRQDGSKFPAEMLLMAKAAGGVRVYVGIVFDMSRPEMP